MFAQEEPAYWIGLNISDSFEESIRVEDGGVSIQDTHQRCADIDVRVGDISFDNTHLLRDSSLLEKGIWNLAPTSNNLHPGCFVKEFDRAYRHSLRRLTKLRSNDAIKVEMEDKSEDFFFVSCSKIFCHPRPSSHSRAKKYWTEELKHSLTLAKGEHILSSGLRLHVERMDSYILNTEGTRVRNQRIHYRMSVYARTKAEDGMDIQVYDYTDAHSLDALLQPMK